MKTDDDRARICPGCDTAEPGEWDPILSVYVCSTCSATWRRPRGRHVPAPPAAPRLPFAMTLISEFPEDT